MEELKLDNIDLMQEIANAYWGQNYMIENELICGNRKKGRDGQ